jgi:hypothetical protein
VRGGEWESEIVCAREQDKICKHSRRRRGVEPATRNQRLQGGWPVRLGCFSAPDNLASNWGTVLRRFSRICGILRKRSAKATGRADDG